MPKVYLTQEQRDRAQDLEYKRAIVAALAVRDMTRGQLADVLKMSRGTLTARLRDPGKITRSEDRAIRRALGMEAPV